MPSRRKVPGSHTRVLSPKARSEALDPLLTDGGLCCGRQKSTQIRQPFILAHSELALANTQSEEIRCGPIESVADAEC